MIYKPCSVLVLAFLSEIEQKLYRPGGYKLVCMLMIMTFALVINFEMPTIICILKFIIRANDIVYYTELVEFL